MSRYVMALDQGTTSTRAVLFNHGGAVVALAQKEHAQVFPTAGWVEHDPDEIWANVQWVISEVVARAGISANDLATLGVRDRCRVAPPHGANRL